MSAIWWIGLVHVAAYALLGTGGVTVWVLNLAFRHFKLSATIIEMYAKVLKERRDAKVHGA